MGFMYRSLKAMKLNSGSTRPGFKCAFSFSSGRTQNIWHRNGFETLHNFKPGVGVHMKDMWDKVPTAQPFAHQALQSVAEKIIRLIDPEWAGAKADWVVQFKKTVSGDISQSSAPCLDGAAVPWHTDSENISHQYLFSLGDHTGGDIITRRRTKKPPSAWQARDTHDGSGTAELRFNYHNDMDKAPPDGMATPRILKMDGRFEHKLGEFKGTRYSVVYYKVYDRRMERPSDLVWPPELIFRA